MSIWEALNPYELTALILAGVVLSAPIYTLWITYKLLTYMNEQIEKYGSILAALAIVLIIIGFYYKNVGLPASSKQFYEFGSYFGGIGAGIGVLIAGLGYLQSARSEKRALEQELIDDELKTKITLINYYEKNIRLHVEIYSTRISNALISIE